MITVTNYLGREILIEWTVVAQWIKHPSARLWRRISSSIPASPVLFVHGAHFRFHLFFFSIFLPNYSDLHWHGPGQACIDVWTSLLGLSGLTDGYLAPHPVNDEYHIPLSRKKHLQAPSGFVIFFAVQDVCVSNDLIVLFVYSIDIRKISKENRQSLRLIDSCR